MPSVLAFSLLVGLASPALSQAYRLVPGDRLMVTYDRQAEPEPLAVDIDGQIRLPDVGGISVAGETLDGAEDRIARAVIEAGILVEPRVNIVVEDYAPILVSGDVSGPGRFEFIAGLTVEGALALSGGIDASGLTQFELDRARTETEGQIASYNLDIAEQAVLVARLTSALADQDEVALSATLRSRIPAPGQVALADLMDNANHILASDRARHRDLMGFWDLEIQAISAQRDLFSERLSVQSEIVASAQEDLATARDLQERGLQTTARLSAAEQREADARDRMLELESASIGAEQALSDARRNRTQFLADTQKSNLADLQAAKVQLDRLALLYERARNQLDLLANDPRTQVGSEVLELRFSLTSPRSDRETGDEITLSTRLMPGDALSVEVVPATPANGG